MAKYNRIVKDIEAMIRNGEMMAYDQLPTVVDLTKRYGVSRSTIEQVLNELEKMGLVSRKRGAGVFVKDVVHDSARVNDISVFQDGELLSRDVATIEVHDFTVVLAPDQVRTALSLHESSFCYYISRSKSYQEDVLAVEYVYYPVEVFHDVRIEAAGGSLRAFLKERYDVVPDTFHKRLRAVLPSAEEAEIFGVGQGTPLLELEQIAFLDDGRPCEYTLARFLAQHAEYQTVDNVSLSL